MNLESFEVGFNIPARIGMYVNEIQTPSLIIDYKVFENNRLVRKYKKEKIPKTVDFTLKRKKA